MKEFVGKQVMVIYDDSGRSGYPVRKTGLLKAVDEVTFTLEKDGRQEVLNKSRIVRITLGDRGESG